MRKFILGLSFCFGFIGAALADNRPVSGVVAVTTGLLQASYTDGTDKVGRDVDTGGAIFLDDLVSTGRGIKSQILLKDHSVFTIGENSKIVFDTFVYDPRTKDGQLTANITQGVFRFVSGKIASKNSEQMTVNVGKATIGVRGTAVAGRVTEEGAELILLSGKIDVSTEQGTQEIIKPGWGVSVSPLGEVSPPAPVPEAQLGTLLTDLSTSDDEQDDGGEEAEASEEPTEEAAEETASEEGEAETEEEASAAEAESEPTEEAADEANETNETSETDEASAETEADTEAEADAGVETETAEAAEPGAPSEPSEAAAEAETGTETETAASETPVDETDQTPTEGAQTERAPTERAPTEVATAEDAPTESNETQPSEAPAVASAEPTPAPKATTDAPPVTNTVTSIAAPTLEEPQLAVIEVAEPQAETPVTVADVPAPVVNEGPPVTVPEVAPVEIVEAPAAPRPSAFDQVVLQTLAARAAAIAVTTPNVPVVAPPQISTQIIAAVTNATNTANDTPADTSSGTTSDGPSEAETAANAPASPEPQAEPLVIAEAVEPEAIAENVADNQSREQTVVTIRAERSEPVAETPRVEEPEPILPTLTAVRGTFETIGENTDTAAALVVGQVDTDDAAGNIVYELGGTDAQYFEISSDGLVRLRANTSLNYEDTAGYDITVAARNENGDSARQAFSIAISDENDLPVITTTSPPGSAQDAVFTYVLGARDEDTGDNLEFSAANLPSWLSLGSNSNGETILTGTPSNDDVGSETITLSVTDGTASSEASFDINIANVNDAPTLSSLSGIAFTDTAGNDSFAVATGTATGTDIDANDSLTYGLANGVVSTLSGYSKQVAGTYGTLYLDETTGDYRYVPDDEAIEGLKSSTSESFTVSVTDGGNASANGTLTVNVSGANDTPTLSSLSGIAFTDTAGNDSFAVATGTATGTDIDANDSLTYGLANGVVSTLSGYSKQVAGTYGTLYLDETTGDYRYVPDDEAIEGLKSSTSESFTVSVTDGGNASANGTLTVNVSGANDTPTLSSLSGIAFTDTAGNDSFAVATGTATGTDVDASEVLTYGVDGGVATNVSGFTKQVVGAYGTFLVNETSGAYQYVPNDAAIEGLKGDANERFDVSVTDSSGAVTQGEITVNVSGANDAPSLSSLAAISLSDTVENNSFVAATAAAMASDLDTAETFTYGVSGGVASALAGYDSKVEGSYGTLHINDSTGSYTYVPDDGKVNALSADTSESFDITVADGSGANATGTVTVNINAVNDAPLNLSISNAVIPSAVAYADSNVTSDNLLSNSDLANSASGWDKTNICSGNTCGTVTNGVLKTGPNTTQLKQDVNIVSALGLTDEQVSKGGVLSWSTEVWMNSNFCMGAYVSDSCNDTATVAVTATNAAGQQLVNEEDERTQKANWETWTQSKSVDEAPTNVTYVMNGKDYTYWGCCGYGPQFRNPSLTYSYTISDDIVVGSLAADDAETDDLSFSLNNDASGLFEIRGNQLILKGGSEISQSGNNAFSLSINVTDANGETSALPLSISVADVAGVAEQIQQQLQSNEDTAFTFEADFGAGETVTGVSLPSWLSLTDLSNGLVRLTGTAPHSGSVSFSLSSTKDGKRTTSHYTMTVDDNCTGAYCTQFVSSNDTVSLATYSLTDGDHYVDDTKFHNFSSWDNLHATLSTGTGTYERTDMLMNSVRGGGNWTGNMRYEIDYGNRTVDSLLWGSFTGYDNGYDSGGAVSGSFTSEDLMDFAKSNSDCYSRAGQCYTNRTPTSQLTCTGTGGTCTANNHSSVSALPVGMIQLLQDGNGAFAAIGQMQVSDGSAGNAEVANTDVLLLDPQ